MFCKETPALEAKWKVNTVVLERPCMWLVCIVQIQYSVNGLGGKGELGNNTRKWESDSHQTVT